MLMVLMATSYLLLVATAVFFAWQLVKSFRRYRLTTNYSDAGMINDLPSVSVCIPARNETHAMTACLERVIQTSYPKLEIIVLDDSSVDDTSILIKSFAHAGVRFVEGSPLPYGWLGKNHALEGLLREASGRYVFFMDVDTQILPSTIGKLVAYARAENAAMVSILPRRSDGWRMSVIWTTLRYFWELIFSSEARPPVASNAWLVHRRTLIDEIGGFDHFSLDVQPETKVAAEFAKTKRYRFLIGSPSLGISYEKKWSSQVETAVRLLFPRVGGQLWRGVLAVAGLAFLNAPTIFMILAGLNGWWQAAALAFFVGLVFGGIYASYTYQTWSRGWWLGGILWPALVFQEMVLMILSIVRYATGQVTWKNRSVLRAQKFDSK